MTDYNFDQRQEPRERMPTTRDLEGTVGMRVEDVRVDDFGRDEPVNPSDIRKSYSVRIPKTYDP